MKKMPGDQIKHLPLTHAQKRIYYDDILHPGAPWANIGFIVKYREKLSLEILAKAIKYTLKKNDGLRLRLVENEDEPEPSQYVSPYEDFPIDFLNFSGPGGEIELQEWLAVNTRKPFQLMDRNLFSFACFHWGDKGSGYYFKLHHLITDGWSCFLLFSQINEIYESLTRGEVVDSACNPSYIQYIDDERAYLISGKAAEDREFWFKTLLPLPEPILISSRKGNPANIEAKKMVLALPGDVRQKMHQYSKEYKSSLYKVSLSALSVYISAVTGLDDMVIGGVNHGRSSESYRQMIGMFVSTFPIRIVVDGNATFHSLMEQIGKDTNVIVKHHQRYPYDLLATELREKNGTNIAYLRNISFVGHSDVEKKKFDYEYIFPGFEPEPLLIHLNISNKDKEGILELEYIYQIEQFSPNDIQRLHHGFATVLANALDCPQKKISEIELVSKPEKHQILYEFNNIKAEFPRHLTLQGLFEDQVQKKPGNIALHFQQRRLSYEQLNEKANQLAWRLRGKGIGPDQVVAIMVDRSIEMIVGTYAILKAGGAYLPINPSYPTERIRYLIKDSGAQLLLTQFEYFDMSSEVDFNGEWLNLDDPLIYDNSSENLDVVNIITDLAYIIYTSGSTGHPKGVLIEHVAAVNLLLTLNQKYPVEEIDKYLLKTSFMFDVSISELFGWFHRGGSLAILGKDKEKDPSEILDAIEEMKVTHINFVPSVFNLFVNILDNKNIIKLKSLKYIFLAGEAIWSESITKFRYLDSQVIIENLYGPTEATVYATRFPVSNWDGYGIIPIGVPIENLELYILGAKDCTASSLKPVGVPGELMISGIGLARGYLNRPELTVEKFIDNPLTEKNQVNQYKKIYKTGDLARWKTDGNIEYLGRIDHQVKIRGFRIETGEIETLLAKQGRVREALVIAREDRFGDKYLCAYLVADMDLDVSIIRDELAKELPEYMIPAYFIQLKEIPLTPTGKVNRKALPEPELSETGVDYVAPRDDIERKLVEIWAKLLYLVPDNLGINDNFFKIGGHSLRAATMIAQIHKELHVKIMMHEIFEMNTIARLAETVRKAKREEFIAIEPIEEKEYYRQTSPQRRMFFMDQLEKDSILYNIQLMDVYCKGIEKEPLEEAFRELIKRHESLRSSFFTVDGMAVQKVHDYEGVGANFKVEYYETMEDGMIYSDEVGKEWTRITGLPFQDVVEHFVKPFDLSRPPLFRAGIIKIWQNTKILMLDMHHIISDGISLVILLNDLWELYGGGVLPPLKIHYKDYSEWLNSERQREEILKQEVFWLKEFSGDISTINLPTDFPRGTKISFEGDMLHFEIGDEETRRLNMMAQEQGNTLYMVLLAVFYVLLAKLSGQDDIVVGSVTAGRGRTDLHPIIGMFVDTLALRNFPLPEKTFKNFLIEVRDRVITAFENQEYPLEELVSKVAPRQETNRNPLFDVVFGLENEANRTEEYLLEALMLDKSNPYKPNRAKFDLMLLGAEKESGLQFILEYKTALFKEKTINRLIGYFKKIVSLVVFNIWQTLADIDIISEEEKHEVLFQFNQVDAEYPREKTIQEIFESQVEKDPNHIALFYQEKHITYRMLNEKGNQLAHQLRRKTVQPDHIVGIMMERSLEMIIAMLAILKAGGAYLPIDPDYPTDRIVYLLEDSSSRLLLTQRKFKGSIQFTGESIDIEDQFLFHGNSLNPCIINSPNDLAYIIYTSGSTGKPKGVMIEHKAVINMAFSQKGTFRILPIDHVLQFSSISFDASVEQIYITLFSGASLVLVDKMVLMDMKNFENFIFTHALSHIHAVPLFVSTIPVKKYSSLKRMVSGGDICPISLVREWTKFCDFCNEYGPTETTVTSIQLLVEKGKPVDVLSIGKALNNTYLYVLDQAMRPLPLGVSGELNIGGDGVARGYLNRPLLTFEKFLPDPFRSNGMLYKTGDLVRWLPDGNMEFLGRIDQQVKIRGFRIELGEIENQLLAIQNIKEAFVLAREDGMGSKFLCAYLVATQLLDNAALKSTLATKLPEYMIPAYFVQLEKIPLTPSGKLDRKALPAPKTKSLHANFVAPTNEIEQVLSEVWAEVLGLEKVSIDDNFFEIGGDSIKTILISARLLKRHLSVNINDFFSSRTIRRLVKFVKKIERKIQQGTVTGNVELTPIQRSFFDKSFKEKHHFHHIMTLDSPEKWNESFVKKVFAKIVEHHDALRMVYQIDELRIIQRNRSTAREEGELFHFQAIDCSNKTRDRIKPDLQKEADLIANHCNIQTGPLLHLKLFKGADGDILVVAIHHAVVDGISWRILLEDFDTGYRQLQRGEEIKFQDKTDAFKEWTLRQKEYADSPKAVSEFSYWKSIEKTHIESFPRDIEVKPEDRKYKNLETIAMHLEPQETEQLLREVNWVYDTEINDILLTALILTVKEWCNMEKVLINLEGHGREGIIEDINISRTVGWFTSQYPVLLDITSAISKYKNESTSSDVDLPLLLRQVKEMLRRIPNKGIGYGILRYLTSPEKKGDFEFKLKPDISFNYLGELGE